LNRALNSTVYQFLVLGFISGLSLAGYLAYSSAVFRNGFPLDDAWIHQTYARNLASSGQMAFIPGVPSAGSTSPAWTALLAMGYLLQVDHLRWAYTLGWFLLWGAAALTWAGFRTLFSSKTSWALAAGVVAALEWHLVWAAGSGMETLLQADLVLIVLVSLLWLEKAECEKHPATRGPWPWLLVGVVIGLSAWVRPDGVTLLGLAGWVVMCGIWPAKDKLRIAACVLLGFCLLFGPYLWFNRILAGELMPTTFFAKQAEYAALRSLPLWQRLLAEFRLPLIGVGALLLAGMAAYLILCLKKRSLAELGGLLWLAGYLGLYAIRLPATYQHGRYIIPAMPVFFLYGLAGLALWFEATRTLPRILYLNRAWVLASGLVLLCFWLVGGRAYAWDVAVIESEMVDTARWINRSTGADTRVAAHDIGALGYYGGREIVDLAGLVSPEVIPILRDEAALEEFLDQHNVSYLVTFPGWYPDLVSQGSASFSTGGDFSPGLGGENMVVYRWTVASKGN
jgi:hypothetical protein